MGYVVRVFDDGEENGYIPASDKEEVVEITQQLIEGATTSRIDRRITVEYVQRGSSPLLIEEYTV